MTVVDAADVEVRLRALATELAANAQRLADARSGLARSEEGWRRRAEQGVVSAAAAATSSLAGTRRSIDANAETARVSALGVARRFIERDLPLFLAADWADDVWAELPTGLAGEWLRVGTATLGRHSLPIALPLSAGVWTVRSVDPQPFRLLVQNAITRLLAAFDPPHLRVVSYDPGLALDLAVFAGVRPLSVASVPPAITSAEAFERALDGLVVDIAADDDRLTAAGRPSYWDALTSGHQLGAVPPLRLLIVGAGTEGLTERGLARLRQVRALAAGRALLVIERLPLSRPAPRPGDEVGALVELTGSTATASLVPELEWRPDPGAGETFIRGLCARLVDRPRPTLAPTVSFAELVDTIEDPWLDEADEGLAAVIGRWDANDLVVRLRSQNPPMPNALIGGAVGEGKSNLLLVLIHALAARYSPADLEMVLVDLRDGVGFAPLGPGPGSRSWLPHVRALGLEFDPDYTVATLRWIMDQMSERATRLKDAGVDTLGGYRRVTGRVMARLLVVVDEFQRLFEGDDDQAAEAASLLESIARTGRGFGVHLVLASQAITGIRGLAVKQDAIFGQFHNRITLRNTAAESQAILAPQNLAAVELEHRGQVVVNDALGAIDHNRVGLVAYADANYLVRLRAELFARGHRDAPPSVFRASSFAEWTVGWRPEVGMSGPTAVVGLPIGIETTPCSVTLSRSPNQGMAVVGSDRTVAISVLARAAVTAAESLSSHRNVTVLDADSDSAGPRPWVAALVDQFAARGFDVLRVGRDQIAARLATLASGRAGLVVAIALDSVDLGTPVAPDYLVPADALRELVKNGPLSGGWTIGWWRSMSILEEQLGYRAPGIRAWAFCGAARDDITSICGHAVREPVARPRLVWFDRTGSRPQRLVPFAVADLVGSADLDRD